MILLYNNSHPTPLPFYQSSNPRGNSQQPPSAVCLLSLARFLRFIPDFLKAIQLKYLVDIFIAFPNPGNPANKTLTPPHPSTPPHLSSPLPLLPSLPPTLLGLGLHHLIYTEQIRLQSVSPPYNRPTFFLLVTIHPTSSIL